MLTNIMVCSRIYKTIRAILFCSSITILLSGLPAAGSIQNPAHPQKGPGSFDICSADICSAINDAGASPDFIRITGFAKVSEGYETLEELKSRFLSLMGAYQNESESELLSSNPLYTLTLEEDKGIRQVKASFTSRGVQGTVIFQNRETETTGRNNNGIINSDIKKEYLCEKITNIDSCDMGDIQEKDLNQGDLSRNYNTFASAEINVYFCRDEMTKTKDRVKNTGGIISATAAKADDIKENLKMYFNHNYNGISISTTYKGTINKKVKHREMESATKTVFDRLGGYEVDKLNEQNFTSRTGYSPGIQDSYGKDNNTMNINVALRCNRYDNKSYLWVGIPVINAEY